MDINEPLLSKSTPEHILAPPPEQPSPPPTPSYIDAQLAQMYARRIKLRERKRALWLGAIMRALESATDLEFYVPIHVDEAKMAREMLPNILKEINTTGEEGETVLCADVEWCEFKRIMKIALTIRWRNVVFFTPHKKN